MKSLNHECGVFGVYNCKQASNITYLGLTAIQHRGQEGAGITSVCDGEFYTHKGRGLVADVFENPDIKNLKGKSALGHVRYSTSGGNVKQNLQPFVFEYAFGKMGIAHNGNLVNSGEIRRNLICEGAIFGSTSDTEIITHKIARSKKGTASERIADALKDLKGAFSLGFITENSLIAVRDPWGIRPLILAEITQEGGEKSFVISSETSPLNLIGARYIRDIEPGEMLEISDKGLKSTKIFKGDFKNASCIFELIYFARPDSIVFEKSVYDFRYRLGELAAQRFKEEADLVSPIPDSGTVSAIGFSDTLKIPFGLSLIRNHYVGRTFIEPKGEIRHFGVKLKLNPVIGLIKGKSIVLVDDSIVRGTTSKKIIREIKNCGAKKVHLVITSPPFKSPCYYGIDTPTKDELIANTMEIEEIRKQIGADSLTYLSIDDLKKAWGESLAFCSACFDGKYAV